MLLHAFPSLPEDPSSRVALFYHMFSSLLVKRVSRRVSKVACFEYILSLFVTFLSLLVSLLSLSVTFVTFRTVYEYVRKVLF